MDENEAQVLELAKQWAHQVRENIRRSPQSDYANDPLSLRIPRAANLNEELLQATWRLLDA